MFLRSFSFVQIVCRLILTLRSDFLPAPGPAFWVVEAVIDKAVIPIVSGGVFLLTVTPDVTTLSTLTRFQCCC